MENTPHIDSILPKAVPPRPELTPAQTNFHQNFGRFDRQGSSYRYEIWRPGRTTYHGYSRPHNQAEKADKRQLLLDMVRRIAAKYLTGENARNTIRWFRNWDDDDSHSELMFTMYHARFEMDSPRLAADTWLHDALKAFYIPPVTIYGNPDDFFGAATPPPPVNKQVIPQRVQPGHNPFNEHLRFQSEDSLHNYIAKLLEQGENRDMVTAYYTKMIRKL